MMQMEPQEPDMGKRQDEDEPFLAAAEWELGAVPAPWYRWGSRFASYLACGHTAEEQ